MEETYVKNTKKPLEDLPIKAFVYISTIIEMIRAETGEEVSVSGIQNLVSRRPAASVAPDLDAIKLGVGRHSLWLVTRDSAEAYVAWKARDRVRPRPGKEETP